jgi:murein DD-endopeptidase MepM/ murein hydrolase activator NlpD
MVKSRPVPCRFFVFLFGSAAISTTLLVGGADSPRQSFPLLADEEPTAAAEAPAEAPPAPTPATAVPSLSPAPAAAAAEAPAVERDGHRPPDQLLRLAAVRRSERAALARPDEPSSAAAAAVPALMLKAEPAAAAPVTLTVGKGDTLIQLLVGNGVDRRDAHEAAAALRQHYDPRKLRVGQELALELGGSGGARLASLRLNLPLDYDLQVTRGDAGFEAKKVRKVVAHQIRRARGVIRSSFIEAAHRAGLPPETAHEMARIFGYAVDFQRDIQTNDRFEAAYEHIRSRDGSYERTGALVYASLTLSGDERKAYRFVTPDGRADYFDGDGVSLRQFLLRTPIDGARLSSGFGLRKHPVLGYSKMHQGTDFAAPSGTAIYAAGDGVVEKVGWVGGYGNYVRIRHNGRYSTAYAHMSRFAKGLRVGSRVEQGQVIGFVGSTGRSTGPHLHYEVLVAGSQVNPMSVDLPTGIELVGADRQRFAEEIGELQTMLASMPLESRLASRD